MNRVIVDPATRAKLHDLGRRLELCDEAGRTLGYFVPTAGEEDLGWAYEWARAQFDDEELERARQQAGGRTTAEVLARLRERR